VTTLCHLLSPFSGLEWFIVIEKNTGNGFALFMGLLGNGAEVYPLFDENKGRKIIP
jgi:hypothetical protein